MSLIYLAWRTGDPADAWDVLRVVKTYEDLVLEKAMRSDCLILDWQRAADVVAPGLLHYDGWRAPRKATGDLFVQEWHYHPRDWTHFTAARFGQPGQLEFDSWPVSKTARYGRLVSLRQYSRGQS